MENWGKTGLCIYRYSTPNGNKPFSSAQKRNSPCYRATGAVGPVVLPPGLFNRRIDNLLLSVKRRGGRWCA